MRRAGWWMGVEDGRLAKDEIARICVLDAEWVARAWRVTSRGVCIKEAVEEKARRTYEFGNELSRFGFGDSVGLEIGGLSWRFCLGDWGAREWGSGMSSWWFDSWSTRRRWRSMYVYNLRDGSDRQQSQGRQRHGQRPRSRRNRAGGQWWLDETATVGRRSAIRPFGEHHLILVALGALSIRTPPPRPSPRPSPLPSPPRRPFSALQFAHRAFQ